MRGFHPSRLFILIAAFLVPILLAGILLSAPVAGQAPLCPGSASGSNDTNVSLPDLTPWVGSSIVIAAPPTAVVTQVTFSVVIRHTYRADLIAELRNGDESTSFRFQDGGGGGADDLVGTWTTDVFDGQPAAQEWKLRVMDQFIVDTGHIDSWSIEVAYEDVCPTPDPTTTPGRAACTRADVAVVVYGAWGGTPVEAFVGGTKQTTLYTASDSQGRQAVLWTFYPPAGKSWEVAVAPQLPAGLDPDRWEYVLLGAESRGANGGWSEASASTVHATRCSAHVLTYQLVDRGVESGN